MTTTSDALVRVRDPEGPGWRTHLIEANGALMRASEIKCTRTDPGEFFFLIAKDYTVPLDQIASAETLLRQVYPKTYLRMFSRVQLDWLGERVVGDKTWVEAGFQFMHPVRGHVVKVERVMVLGQHVLILSGEGNPADMNRHAATMSAWMERTTFGMHGEIGERARVLETIYRADAEYDGLPTAELEQVLARGTPERARAMGALARRAAHDDALRPRVLELIRERRQNTAWIMTTISLAHFGIACMYAVASPTVRQELHTLITAWPEPDRADLLWFLGSQCLIRWSDAGT
jgi:hypothetical protein